MFVIALSRFAKRQENRLSAVLQLLALAGLQLTTSATDFIVGWFNKVVEPSDSLR